MLLAIAAEKIAIESEIKLLDRLRYKLSNQMRHFKEFNQLKLILKLVEKHIHTLHFI